MSDYKAIVTGATGIQVRAESRPHNECLRVQLTIVIVPGNVTQHALTAPEPDGHYVAIESRTCTPNQGCSRHLTEIMAASTL
jgi:hypothetical protein